MNKHLVAGVDEAGCGPLAGPVVAAAVILDPSRPVEGVMDSKKLSEKRREALFPLIQETCVAWAVGQADIEEIDRLNIYHASLLAMKRAVEGLSVRPDHALIDGNRRPELTCTLETIIKGDQTVLAISAASILAKVTRDRQMRAYENEYPGYGFATHKGYGTKAHYEAIARLGITPIHRRSFKLIKT